MPAESVLLGARKDPDLDVRVRGTATTPIASIELYDFKFHRPQDVDFKPERSFLDLALSRRAGDPQGRYLGVPGHRDRAMGEVIFIPAGERLHSWWQGGPQSSISLQFHASHEGDKEWTTAELDASLDVRNPYIRDCLVRLAREIEEPGFQSETMIDALCIQIGIELGRHFVGTRSAEQKPAGRLSTAQLRRIEERLDVSGPVPGVAELAAECGLSTRHFCRIFRMTAGATLSEFAAQRRIARAQDLLVGQRMPIKQVSWACGFETPAAFSAAFRRATGYQPSSYRRLMSW